MTSKVSDFEAMDTSSPRGSTSDDSTLVDEYNAWRQNDRNTIKLRETRTDDGKTSLDFSIEASEQKFTLHCPSHYPNYGNDDNFFVEADSGLQMWCNALNEYLLDSDEQLSLSSILNKGLSLYSSADAKTRSRDVSMSSNANEEDEDYDEMADMDEEDDGLGDDDTLEDILDNDLSWELEIARRRKRWRNKERELRDACKKTNSSSGSTSGSGSGGGLANETNDESTLYQHSYQDPSIKGRQPKQVFSTDAASGILINDLVSIMESATETGISADTIDDNIFQWNVKIKNFASSNLLEKDFEELMQRYFYDYIELQLDFAMDLYPFFPPLVKVIRPRLQGSMMLRVTTMEILKLSHWNPAKNMKTVLIDIKEFLQTWARLDFKSERNDRSRYPDGAYIDIEHHLLRLALVSEVAPRANKKYASPTPPVSLPWSAMEGSASASSSTSTKTPTASALAFIPSVASTAAAAAAAPSLAAGSSLISPDKGATSKDEKEEKKKDETPKKQKSKFCLFGMNKDKESSEEKAKKKEANQRKNMAKGVGYSSYQQKGWDVKAYMAAQKEKDKQIELVLAKIYHELKKLHSHTVASRNLPDLVDGAISGGSQEMPAVEVDSRVTSNNAKSGVSADRGGSRRKRKHSPDEIVGGAASGNNTSCSSDENSSPIDPVSDLYAVLEGSALIPFLESKLQANSFLEICNHSSVYRCVINIIRELAQPGLTTLLGQLPDQTQSLHSLLLSLESQAQILLDKIGKSSANGSVPKSGKASSDKVTEKTTDDRLARDFVSLSKEVSKVLRNAGYWPDINGETTTSSSATAQSPNSSVNFTEANGGLEVDGEPLPGPSGLQEGALCDLKNKENPAIEFYKKIMKDVQIDTCEFAVQGPNTHAYSSAFTKAGMPSSSVVFRVAQELSSLSTSLPLDFSSAIFLRTDDDKPTLMRVLITGPEDTPYSGGCYVFDFFFPGKYPNSPPTVNFRTTGGGSVRFNPNLYNCGKVCLSLLGTWGGAQGEQWNETSTVLQVLISIQSLILCAEPYYNEPGFERLYGTPQGDSESLKYSEEVFRNNLKYAVVGQLTNPPEGFEDVVRAHFYLKRDFLLEEYEKMTEKFKSRDVKKQLADVKREFQKLEPPAALKKLKP